MAITLMIEGRPLTSVSCRGSTDIVGTVQPAGGWVIADAIEELRACARDLRNPSLRSGADQPRQRRIFADALDMMEERGHLRPEQARAGREISMCSQLVMGIDSPGVGRYSDMVQLPNGEMIPARFGAMMMDRFLPWRSWARHTYTNRARTRTYELIANEVCLNGWGPQQAADRLRMCRKDLLRHLREGLWRYCETAGWVEAGPEQAA